MKRFLITLLGCCLAASLPAQSAADNPPTKLAPDELEELLGPIALYPDALIALILPASTYPSDVVLGARFVAANGDPATLEDKSWDSSVKALTRYPETLAWMDENLEWTTQLGDAFIEQPVEVMEAIQQLRGKARAFGNLNDTPQQRIIQDDADYRIIPAQPDYIYEPRYDPDVIYYERAVSEPLIYFSTGYVVGSWLNYDCDWRRHRLYRGDWHEGWDYRREAERRDRDDDFRISNKLTNAREWRPDPIRRREQSHHVAERSKVQDNPPSRASSRDSGKGDSKDDRKVGNSGHHAGIARPKAIAGSHGRPESVKRAVPVDDDKKGKGASPRTAPDSNKGRGDSKDHVAKPKSMAPGTSDAGRGKDDNHKKSNDDSPRTAHKADAPSKKEGDGRGMHVETPKHDSGKQAEPKRNDSPKHEEMKKQDEPRHKEVPKQVERKREEPKHQEAPKQVERKREEPKRQEAPKHVERKREEPKHQEAPKRVEAPKRQEQPKHEADKPRGDSPKKGDKKDDDDDKKKKKK
jgi:hypothetical protein